MVDRSQSQNKGAGRQGSAPEIRDNCEQENSRPKCGYKIANSFEETVAFLGAVWRKSNAKPCSNFNAVSFQNIISHAY